MQRREVSAICFLILLMVIAISNPIPLLADEGITYSNQRNYHLVFNTTVKNIDATMSSLRIWGPQPVQWDSQRNVVSHGYPEPRDSIVERSGNGVFFWMFLPGPSKGKSVTVTIDTYFTCFEVHSKINLENVGEYEKNAEYIAYTKSEDYIESGDTRIGATAREIVGTEVNPYRKAELIYKWVLFHMTYKIQGEFKGTLFAYENGNGECGEYAALFCALCRAVGVPARTVVGLTWDNPGVYPSGADRGVHVYAEFLVPNYGWIPVDPSIGDSGRSDFYFGNTDLQFLIMSKGANIRLSNELTASVFQMPYYWYYGSAGDTDYKYRYEVENVETSTSSTTTSAISSPSLTTSSSMALATTSMSPIENTHQSFNMSTTYITIIAAIIIVAAVVLLKRRKTVS